MTTDTLGSSILDESNLLFLISLPRSGSTMLQMVLGNHPEIHTVSEPWIMLPILSGLEDSQVAASYDTAAAAKAIRDFCAGLPGGRDEYYRAARVFGCTLYSKALEETGKSIFLDKTPRYHMVVSELANTFPKARFIFLIRHPLAIFSSVLSTWIWPGHSLQLLERHLPDLLDGWTNLREGLAKLEGRAHRVDYERFVSDPEENLHRITEWLGVPESKAALELKQPSNRWRYGDPTNVYSEGGPTEKFVDKWQIFLHDPLRWCLAERYLLLLDAASLEDIGYLREDIFSELRRIRPHGIRSSDRYLSELTFAQRQPPSLKARIWQAQRRALGRTIPEVMAIEST